jgi:hypothetical protein
MFLTDHIALDGLSFTRAVPLLGANEHTGAEGARRISKLGITRANVVTRRPGYARLSVMRRSFPCGRFTPSEERNSSTVTRAVSGGER